MSISYYSSLNIFTLIQTSQEMKRIDAEMARLVDVGNESRDAFRKESEIASTL